MDDATHPALVALTAAREAVAAAREALLVQGWSLTDRELTDAVTGWHAMTPQVSAGYLCSVAALDARPEAVCGPARAGHRTAAGFLVSRCHVNKGAAARDVAAARALAPTCAGRDWAAGPAAPRPGTRSLPAFAEALGAGEISSEHVHVAVRCLKRIPVSLLDQPSVTDATRTGGDVIENVLLATSRAMPPRDVDELATQLHARLDAKPERDPGEAFLRRGVTLVTDATGMVLIRGQLDPATGAAVKAVVDFHAAPAPATQDGLTTLADPRTAGQRTADAFGIIARLAAASSGARGMEPPLVLVTATLEQVTHARATAAHRVAMSPPGLSTCAQTGLLTPTWLDVLSCDATLQRAVLTATGEVLHLGTSVRLATRAQRRALAARDGAHCLVPGCGAPIGALDAHHIRSWHDNGPTNLPNLVSLCGRHHTETHLALLDVVVVDGLPHVRPPAWVDPERQPVRHTSHETARRAQHLADQLSLPLDPPPP